MTPGAKIRIVDREGADVADTVQGELLVRAASTLTRYHKNPDLTCDTVRDGFFVTGDLGYRDSQGYYFLTGRIKDVIIRGGANVSPPEVEEALLEHEDVRAAAVVGRADAIYGEVPVAFVVTRNAVADEAALIAHCRARLAEFKVPVNIRSVPELPLGITGKIDKNALRARLEKGE